MRTSQNIETTLNTIIIFLCASASAHLIHRHPMQTYPDITTCILLTYFFYNQTPTQATIISCITDLLFPQSYINTIILTRISLLLVFNMTAQLFLHTTPFNQIRLFALHAIVQFCYGIITGPHNNAWFIQNHIRLTITNYLITTIFVIIWHKIHHNPCRHN